MDKQDIFYFANIHNTISDNNQNLKKVAINNLLSYIFQQTLNLKHILS